MNKRPLFLAAALAGPLAFPQAPAAAAHSPKPHLAQPGQISLAAKEAKQAAHLASARMALAVHNAHLAQVAHNAKVRQMIAKAQLQAALHQQRLAEAEVRMQTKLTVQAKHAAMHQLQMMAKLHKAQLHLAALHHQNALRMAKLQNQHVAMASGNVVMAAYSLRGSRYVMGGTSRSGFDCSGFVRYVLSAADGVAIPRTAAEQYYHGKPIAMVNMEPGDLVFFKNTYKHGISHVGIYAGQGKFIHAANSHKGVRMDLLNAPYYRSHFAGARRVLPDQMRQAAFLR